ncbi:alpha/beta hydrolase [Plectonema cf. radiosum LEGE 06105]|uniref:Alpha/beta hydrolase n=1 Tax=Plectonema cf. radiosum LEGE 06105 TaxID=945769 RepID=A0A8J7JSE3_9CYAN|nr:alpha/beta hydrolase [Plectonema radiosum]MBE9212444.1 alpha/beta hydrolase [Plectonema cf. radiosum LEGE 06105]
MVCKKSIWLNIALSAVITSVSPILNHRPAVSAERLKLSFGIVERSISVDSLEIYAKTGQVNDELAVYFKYVPEASQEELREVLLAPIPLKAVEVSQFLYSPIGEKLLENLSQVFQHEFRDRNQASANKLRRSSGFYATRSALILAAIEPNNFTIINILRKFPSQTISIDLFRSLEIGLRARNIVNRTQKAVALINEQSLKQTGRETISNNTISNALRPGRLTYTKESFTLTDISRIRSFPLDIYLPQNLPQTTKPLPVIVISHGLGSDRSSFAYLAEYLASHGFVVAVPEHPGSNSQQLQALLGGIANEVTDPREFIDRPLDVKYILDYLESLSDSNPAYKGRFNMEQVGVIGQSFGGYTALALAGAEINFAELRENCPVNQDTLNVSLLLQCLALNLPEFDYKLSDSRVKAVVAINPVDSSVYGKEGLSKINIPVMIVAGTADTVAPAYPEQIIPFTWLTNENKYLVLMNGGTHFSTIAESPNSTIPVPSQVVGASPNLARDYTSYLALGMFKSYVENNPNYRRYLSADYINSVGQGQLFLSVVTELTNEQLSSINKEEKRLNLATYP